MPSPKQPAVLIVHGAYFLPESWTPFTDVLSGAGFLVRCPRLPTCGDVRPPKATLQDDVTAVRSVATQLANSGHPIIILAHSYGGIVASEAICEDLYAKQPSSPDATRGGVVHLIYLCAFLVQPGDSLGDIQGKYGMQTKVDLGFNEDGTVWAKNAPDSFYNDMETGRAQELAKKNVTSNWSVVSSKVSHAPWEDVPTTYVHCAKDMAILLGLQKSMVKDAVESGGAADLSTVTCDSGHCPFLSMPAEVVGIVEKVWADAQSR